jgi:hypothetical protein
MSRNTKHQVLAKLRRQYSKAGAEYKSQLLDQAIAPVGLSPQGRHPRPARSAGCLHALCKGPLGQLLNHFLPTHRLTSWRRRNPARENRPCESVARRSRLRTSATGGGTQPGQEAPFARHSGNSYFWRTTKEKLRYGIAFTTNAKEYTRIRNENYWKTQTAIENPQPQGWNSRRFRWSWRLFGWRRRVIHTLIGV